MQFCPNRIALDLSTIATGWAYGSGPKPSHFGTIIPPKECKTLAARLVHMTDSVEKMTIAVVSTEVVIEEFNFLRGMPAIRALAGLRGAVLYALTKRDCVVKFANRPEFLKKLGMRGNAKKDEVLRWAALHGFAVKNDNEADAIAVYLGASL